jgi:hypothetical protein
MFKADTETARPSLAAGVHLYATAQRGAIVEAMFARVTRAGITLELELWVYSKKHSLVRGSGIHVGQEGVTCDHHFLFPEGEEVFQWQPGEYTVEILGTIVGKRGLHRFVQLKLVLDEAIREPGDSVFFDWQPGSGTYKGRYLRHAERMREKADRFRALMVNAIPGDDDEIEAEY